MNFHEYQSKQLLAEYGIPVPAGKVAATPDEAVAAAQSLGQGPWMVKAQIHAGGRGKAGGVKFCKTTDDVKAAAAKMLGTKMATYQTAGVELPVNLVLVTTAGEIVKELYLSVLVDRGTKTITYIASSEGGVEIEQVAAETPELIHSLNVDFVEGVQGYHGRDFGFKLGLTAKQAGQFASIMVNLYRLFNERTWRWLKSTRWRSWTTATCTRWTASSTATTTPRSVRRRWSPCATRPRKIRPK